MPAAPAELPDALAACAGDLVERLKLAGDEARVIAASAFSELSARQTGCYVDLELTTKDLVVIADTRAGVLRMIPVIDIVRILGPVQVAKAG